MAHTWEQLTNMTEEELIRAHDSAAASSISSLNLMRDEIMRRAYNRATDASLEEARRSRQVARVNAAVAALSLLMAVGSLIVALVAIQIGY